MSSKIYKSIYIQNIMSNIGVIQTLSPNELETQNFAVNFCDDYNIEHSLSNPNQIVPGDWQVYMWMLNFGLQNDASSYSFAFKRPLKPGKEVEISQAGINMGKRGVLSVKVEDLEAKAVDISLFKTQNSTLNHLMEHYCLISGDLLHMVKPSLNAQGYHIQKDVSRPIYLGSEISIIEPMFDSKSNYTLSDLQRKHLKTSIEFSASGEHLQADLTFKFGLYLPKIEVVTATIEKSVRYTKLLNL